MTKSSDGWVAPGALDKREALLKGNTRPPESISSRQWLMIARFFAVIPLLAALAFAVLFTVDTRAAKALDSEEQTFLSIINDYRAANGLGTLAIDPQLNDVALWMANDMASNDYFSHTDSLGRDPFQRMDQMGYTYNTWRGENLVAGTEGAQASFEMWTGSPGHNANMLGEHYTVIGIARKFNQSSSFGWYWATEFGGQTAPLPPPPAPPTATPQPTPTAAPQVQDPVEPPPPPAPTKTPAPTPVKIADETPEGKPVKTPVRTPTPEIKATTPLDSSASWWRSLKTVSDRWDAADGGRRAFVSAVRGLSRVFGAG